MVVTARGRRESAAYGQPAAPAALVALTVAGAVLLTVAAFTAVNAAPSPSAVALLPATGALETEQEVPPAPGAHGWLWFAERGPAAAEGVLGATADAEADPEADAVAAAAASTGPGIWHRAAETAPWEWTALAPELLTRWSYDGAGAPPSPSWPSDVTRLQAQQVVRPDADALGYWVWNPSVFAGGASGSGSHFWSPQWQWAPSGEPLPLAP